MVQKAVSDYFAIADLDSHGVNHIFIEFPNMYQAARWAHDFGEMSHVRYIAPESNLEKTIATSIKVIFEF